MVVVKKSHILYALCIIAQISRSSAWLKTVGGWDDLMTVVQLFCLLFFGYVKIKKQRIFVLDIAILLFYAALLIPTFLVSKDYISWATYMIQGAGAVFLIEEMLDDDMLGGLRLLRNISFGFILINLFSLVRYSDGLNSDDYFFLGSRIGFTPFILLAVMSAVAYDYIANKQKISGFSICCIVVGALNLFFPMVGTGLLTVSIFIILLFYERFGNHKRTLLNYWVLLVLAIVATVVALSQLEIRRLNPIFDLVGKDSTFNGRDIIWMCAKYYILQRPLLGHGVTPTGAFLVFAYVNQRMMPAHNEILNVLYQGGILSGLAFAVLFVIVGRTVTKCRERRIANICAIFIFCFCIVMITEIQTQKAIVFMVLAMVYKMALGEKYE